MRFETISAAFFSGYRYEAENILRSIVVASLLMCTPIPSNAVVFGLSANYADGTMFSVTYGDSDGDGLCSPCRLVAASVTLGPVLQAAIDFTSVDTFAVDLRDLVDAEIAAGSVFNVGLFPSWLFVFSSPDILGKLASGDLEDGVVFSSGYASLYDARCYTGDGQGGDPSLCPGAVGVASEAGPVPLESVTYTGHPTAIPEPVPLSLVAVGLLGILGRRVTAGQSGRGRTA